MESFNETRVELTGHKREEEKMFDFASFKEAWQNACLHTKWDRKNPPAVYISQIESRSFQPEVFLSI